MTHAVSAAGQDLELAIQQARQTFLNAERTIAAGKQNFQQVAAASREAEEATVDAVERSEAATESTIRAMAEELRQVEQEFVDSIDTTLAPEE